MTDEQLTAIEQRRAAAKAEVIAICAGKRWRMCIPVEQTDSDICIINALDDVPALVAEVRRLRQFEAMAIDNFGELESASMDAHSEALILFESMKAQLYPESEATPSQTTVGLVLQISNMAAGLRDERDQLRADVERLTHECDELKIANLNLQGN